MLPPIIVNESNVFSLIRVKFLRARYLSIPKRKKVIELMRIKKRRTIFTKDYTLHIVWLQGLEVNVQRGSHGSVQDSVSASSNS